MCAIAGCFGSRDKQVVKQMLGVMSHGGATTCSIYDNDNMVWGHAGSGNGLEQDAQQPILTVDQSTAVMASGEIYNVQAIRDRFQQRHAFQSHCEAEVVLALYGQRGPDGVRDLDGMFAFALFDRQRSVFMLARDPIGIKPLYYGFRNGTIYFTSDREAMREAEVDEIQEFPPGYYYTSTDGFIRYYQLPKVDRRPLRDKKSIAWRIRQRLAGAVAKRVVIDHGQPMGAFCSGGLNSSLVAALAARQVDELHTFTVGMRDGLGNEADDMQAARLVADHIGSTHHEWSFTLNDYHEALYRVIHSLGSYDPSLIRSAVPCYLAARLAGEYGKVMLSGEGADELFGGYHYMWHIPAARLNEEGRRCLANLHNINLQHTDRMALRCSLEQRIPFLDKEMIALAMKIPADLKIKEEEDGLKTGKWILRQAFSGRGLLPKETLWRGKVPMTAGSACELAGARLADRQIDKEDLARLQRNYPAVTLASKESALYFTIFQETQSA